MGAPNKSNGQVLALLVFRGTLALAAGLLLWTAFPDNTLLLAVTRAAALFFFFLVVLVALVLAGLFQMILQRWKPLPPAVAYVVYRGLGFVLVGAGFAGLARAMLWLRDLVVAAI